MRRVAVVATAQTDLTSGDSEVGTPERAFEVSRAAVEASGLDRGEIAVTLSASSDMLEGRSFNFVHGLEALGTWPPVHESHVEMDGAWAAYAAWVKLLTGEFDSALVVAWGKTSEGSLPAVLNTQLDPFVLAPLGLDHVTTAALQADAYLARTGVGMDALDAVAERSAAAGAANLRLSRMDPPREDGPAASPLWRRHLPREADGACAIVLAAEGTAERLCERPAWIAGADHRTETGALGHRDLSRSPATELAATRARELAGWDDAAVDVAEIGASFAHQEPLLREALGLDAGADVNPSGGPMAADPLMSTGLIRLAEAASRVMAGTARRALAHASAGHALQQSMVWLLDGVAP
ncbi:MAG: lipid-transfer protein [Actinomycetota bacterium]